MFRPRWQPEILKILRLRRNKNNARRKQPEGREEFQSGNDASASRLVHDLITVLENSQGREGRGRSSKTKSDGKAGKQRAAAQVATAADTRMVFERSTANRPKFIVAIPMWL